MSKNSQISDNEINLIELIQTVWEGKWKIAIVAVITFTAVISYQSIKLRNFTAVTEVKPISTLKINEYSFLNKVIDLNKIKIGDENENEAESKTNLGKIKKSKLLNLYLEVLQEKSLFEEAIHRFNLLDSSQYTEEQKYNEAIIKLASSIKILTPSGASNNSIRKGSLELSYHSISFTYDDIEKWKNVLIYVDEKANRLVKKTLVEDFDRILLVNENLKEYMIKIREQEKKNKIEDFKVDIENLVDDYDRSTYDRLAYLREQSAIAESLGIENNTFEAQSLNNENLFMTNIQGPAGPFYLRGYKAINKEIELITLRVEKKAFVENLHSLEKALRSVEQDKTIERIKKEQNSLDLIKETLRSSPLGDGNDFISASTNVITTKVVYNRNNKQMLYIAIIIGLIFGVFYVFISNAIKFHKVSRKK